MKFNMIPESEVTVRKVTVCIARVVRYDDQKEQNEQYSRFISQETMQKTQVPQARRSYFRVMGLN